MRMHIVFIHSVLAGGCGCGLGVWVSGCLCVCVSVFARVCA